jgi:hypothetical protein
MRLDRRIVEIIAGHSLGGSYRQTAAFTTRDLERWMEERDIGLKWDSIHRLWSVGALRPVAVELEAIKNTPDVDEPGRFLEYDTERAGRIALDLGTELTEDRLVRAPEQFDDALRTSLWWHPFQAWELAHVASLLEVRVVRDASLQEKESYKNLAGFWMDRMRQSLIHFSEDQIRESFSRLLALLLSVDPLVHLDVYGSHTFAGWILRTDNRYSPMLISRSKRPRYGMTESPSSARLMIPSGRSVKLYGDQVVSPEKGSKKRRSLPMTSTTLPS